VAEFSVFSIFGMKIFYVFSKSDPFLLLYELDMKKRVEHSRHKRFRLDKESYALIRPISEGPLKIEGKSMGSIACAVFNAKPVRLGIIDNLSMGGLMFQHVDNRIKLNHAIVLDILLAECGFYLADIPFYIITDSIISDNVSANPIVMRQVRMQFQRLNAKQEAKLIDLILNHGVEIDEISSKV
jgi:hypothetical protein